MKSGESRIVRDYPGFTRKGLYAIYRESLKLLYR
jgi:hypothetical protein